MSESCYGMALILDKCGLKHCVEVY